MQVEVLARARCFDLRPVEALITETARELIAASEREDEDGTGVTYRLDLGDRALIPAPVTWLEWSGGAVLLDGLADGVPADERPPPGSAVVLGLDPDALAHGLSVIGAIHLDAGVARLSRLSSGDPSGVNADELGLRLTYEALAALAVIASPAAERSAEAGHRGAQRDIRRASGIEPALAFTRVTLKGQALHDGATGAGSPHPKAYHFCRAHFRKRASGAVERVRAHWRGDPAFGVRLPSYTVAQAAASEPR